MSARKPDRDGVAPEGLLRRERLLAAGKVEAGGPDSDGDAQLASYIRLSFTHLMTDLECRAATAVAMELKAAGEERRSPGMAAKLRARSPATDPAVRELLAAGADAFWVAVRDRLGREHPTEFVLAHCSRCGRLLRTPRARQCLACGLDWHERG